MNWKNVKIFLIILLAAANLYFAVSYISSMNQNTHIDEQSLQNTVEFLNKNKVGITEDMIPPQLFNTNIIECPMSDDYYENVAAKIRLCERESINILPDDSIRILMSDGSVFVFDSQFSVSFSAASAGNSPSIIDDADNSEIKLSFTEALLNEAQTASLLNFIYPDKTSTPKCFSYRLIASYSDIDRNITAEIIQTAYGYDINKNTVTVKFEGDQVTSLNGTWFYPTGAEEYSNQLYDQLSVLIKDVQNSYLELNDTKDGMLYDVSSLEYVYCAYWGSDKRNIYFIPAWKITTDEPSIRVYNAANCELYE